MEIRIGRNPESNRLQLSDGEKTVLYGAAQVPDSVLQEHCLLMIDDNAIRIQNLDINSYTYVNGRPVESKVISINDKITLGKNFYPLNWEALRPYLPVDIRPLLEIWNEYEDQNISLQIAERRFNTLRSATGLITMVAIALSIATGGRSVWYIALYAVAIIISLLLFIKAYIDSAKIPQKRQDLTRQFQRDYACPQCGHFMGNQSYDILAQNSHCPYCKTKFIH